MKLRWLIVLAGILLVQVPYTYAQGKRKNVTKAVEAAVSKKVVSVKASKAPKTPKVTAMRATSAPVAAPRASAASAAPARVGHIGAPVSAAEIAPKPAAAAKKFAETGHPLTRLLPTAYLYENGQDYGKITEYLMNEAMDRVAADATAWDVRKETHQLFQTVLGGVPKFLYTNDAVNDMFDVLSLEQFMAKNGKNFPLGFAQTAAQDGIGEQMSTFLVKRYLLGGSSIMQVQEYLWDLYAKAPNVRSMEEIVSDVEAFVATHNRLPGIVFLAGSEQVAPVMRSALNMTPEEIALGTEMVLVTHISSWSWMSLPEGLSPRIRALYDKVEEAVKSWRGEGSFNRTAAAPNL